MFLFLIISNPHRRFWFGLVCTFTSISSKVYFRDSYLIFFTPRSLLRMGYCRHCTRTYVRTYVRPKFFLRFLVFWDPHVGSSWRFFHFLKKMIFWACHALFLTIFLIYKGLLGARCKSGDLCWKGFVCRFWIYIVVRPDLFFAFLKKAFVSPAD